MYILYITHTYITYKRQHYIIIILSFNFFTNCLRPSLQTRQYRNTILYICQNDQQDGTSGITTLRDQHDVTYCKV